ncbi:MAG TPA: SDR family NAD(P)-dependent oxidoreductase [Xanthobacteraceae bacterium]|nr:SDR family NAD(P)-dependent oxidoreductase [Xanthobacteraceae bacterium]HQS48530.1 SDR family NAD(P)-dependent oxidoreductase [Xanthobacteraceae bacterium]
MSASARSHSGRVVLVTGSGRGIGRAMADAHADAGAALAYLDHDAALAQEAAAAAIARGVKAIAVSADVADYDAVAAAIGEAAAALGPIDVLVNNAGISPKSGADKRRVDAFAMDPAEWRRVIDVNLTGAFNCTRVVLPGMRDLGRGRIVNVSSVAGRTYCDIVAVHYAASKAALIGFTKHLAGELGPLGITVNALAPGRIDTPLMRGTAPEANEAARMATPLRRLGSPQDVADTCLFLTSDQAGFVTGQVVDVAGGWLLT